MWDEIDERTGRRRLERQGVGCPFELVMTGWGAVPMPREPRDVDFERSAPYEQGESYTYYLGVMGAIALIIFAVVGMLFYIGR